MANRLHFSVSAGSGYSLKKTGNCFGCGLLRSDPLAYLFDRASKQDSRTSQEIKLKRLDWKDGAELGCVLCNLVEEITQDIARRHDWGRATEVGLLVGPYRCDTPYYIRLTAFKFDTDKNPNNTWEVELFVTKGMTPQFLCHSYTILEAVIDILSLRVEIDIDNPLPKLPLRRHLGPDFKSEQCLGLVKTWLRQCKAEHSHATCRSREVPLLPTRVLDISAPNPMLILAATNDRGLFAALSHCWGNPKSSSLEPPTLLRSNLDTFVSTGVPVSSLPLSFSDAIDVCRYLGYRYLWIDSLCIIQDDNKDWERESGLMAVVYGNADLVIGASSAAHGSQGFLGSRQGFIDGLVSLSEANGSRTTPWQACYRTSFPHSPFKESREAFRPANEGPLESRAWAYQERLLARRFISFGSHELCWECPSLLECECYTVHDCQDAREGMVPTRTVLLPPRKYNLQRKLEQDINIDNLLGTWRKNVVERYTKRQLTNATDRLVALSAIAYQFSKRIWHPYLAGIWLSDVDKRGLLWGCVEPSNGTIPGAPSWSWASVHGPVIYSTVKSVNHSTRDTRNYCPVLVGLDQLTSSRNNFSHPYSSYLQFQGKIMSGVSVTRKVIQEQHDRTVSFGLRVPQGGVLQLYMDSDIAKMEPFDAGGSVSFLTRRRAESQDQCELVEAAEQSEVYSGLFCLNIAAPIALLLTRTSAQETSFERLGLCVLTGCDVGSWETGDVKII